MSIAETARGLPEPERASLIAELNGTLESRASLAIAESSRRLREIELGRVRLKPIESPRAFIDALRRERGLAPL